MRVHVGGETATTKTRMGGTGSDDEPYDVSILISLVDVAHPPSTESSLASRFVALLENSF